MKNALKTLGVAAAMLAVIWIIGALEAGWEWVFNLAPDFFGIAMLAAIGWGTYKILKLIAKEIN